MAKKLKKFPKQPKLSSAKAVFDRWEKKCAEVAKYNGTIQAEKKAKETIKAKVSKMKDKQK